MFGQLEVFLTQRISEMGEDGDVVAMSQFQLAPSVIQGQSREHIREMLSRVQDLVGRLTSLRMQHLFMIQASPRYAATTDPPHSINSSQQQKHNTKGMRIGTMFFPANVFFNFLIIVCMKCVV